MAELSQGELTYLIVVGSVGMLVATVGFAFFIVIYQKRMLQEHQKQKKSEEEYQQKMLLAQLESQETERKRIASDLHDSVGSLLWGAKVNASYLERTVDFESGARESFQELVEILDQSIQTVRRIAWELTPEVFHHAGLSISLNKLCERIDGKGMKVTFNETGGGQLWNNDEALQVYRIVQELVSNSIKHSMAANLTVSLAWEKAALGIEVEDDGKGFRLNGVQAGVGWWNIKQRVKQLNADFKIGHSPMGVGTLVSMSIPLNNEK